ncbi:hypothetical protein [Haematobacter missouriensis]|uniref:Uncharacterized protein n=1 Tax=Haematobacter missouriensis TaxID=366616 RepID=A0A212AIQ6_9RHOB|nr:hypothetical protein [Haematobacter missouriensis]OWJ81384.1 hypothetical protein CDV52_18470 [Haematobacter missouriensis]
MNILEITTAAVIGLYAMVGGAFLSASITAPENCLKVISALWSEFLSAYLGTLVGLGLLLLASMTWGDGTIYASIMEPMLWLFIVHTLLFALFLICLNIATRLSPTEEKSTDKAP